MIDSLEVMHKLIFTIPSVIQISSISSINSINSIWLRFKLMKNLDLVADFRSLM